MSLSSLRERGRTKLIEAFCASVGQMRRNVGTGQGQGGYPVENFQPYGDSFPCSLYSPKGSEIPEPLALLNRTIFWLAGDYPADAKAKDQVVVDGQTFEVHDVQIDRTLQMLPRMMVSRLK